MGRPISDLESEPDSAPTALCDTNKPGLPSSWIRLDPTCPECRLKGIFLFPYVDDVIVWENWEPLPVPPDGTEPLVYVLKFIYKKEAHTHFTKYPFGT
jgi:hypothetical protein